MKTLHSFGSAALTLGVALVVTGPASAAVETFATYSASTAAKNIRYVNSGNSNIRTTDAVLYTTATAAATTPGAAPVTFSFLIPALAPFVTDVAALYTFNGTIAKGSPVAATGAFSQSGLSGTFSFLTTTAITVSGPGFLTHTYAAGSTLLAGSFTGGSILGTIGGTSGSSFASGLSGGTIMYTSDFLDFTGAIELDRAQSLTAVSPRFTKHAGANGSLSAFRAVAGGQFSSDPVPIVNYLAVVPEPATWGLMLVGFCMTGMAVRRRQTIVAS